MYELEQYSNKENSLPISFNNVTIKGDEKFLDKEIITGVIRPQDEDKDEEVDYDLTINPLRSGNYLITISDDVSSNDGILYYTPDGFIRLLITMICLAEQVSLPALDVNKYPTLQESFDEITRDLGLVDAEEEVKDRVLILFIPKK